MADLTVVISNHKPWRKYTERRPTLVTQSEEKSEYLIDQMRPAVDENFQPFYKLVSTPWELLQGGRRINRFKFKFV